MDVFYFLFIDNLIDQVEVKTDVFLKAGNFKFILLIPNTGLKVRAKDTTAILGVA